VTSTVGSATCGLRVYRGRRAHPTDGTHQWATVSAELRRAAPYELVRRSGESVALWPRAGRAARRGHSRAVRDWAGSAP